MASCSLQRAHPAIIAPQDSGLQMRIFSHGRSVAREPASNSDTIEAAGQSAPRFLLDIEPWPKAFLRNAADLLLLRSEPQIEPTSSPGDFWPDVFVHRTLPFDPLWRSGLCHVLVLVAMWAYPRLWLLRADQVRPQNPLQRSTITYYKISEYLPPIQTPDTSPAKVAKQGDPAHAKQKVVSRSPEPVSHNQTILSAADIKLPQDIQTPNIVSWNSIPPPDPDMIPPRPVRQMSGPVLVVPPPPLVDSPRFPAVLGQIVAAIPPAPDLSTAILRTPRDIIARNVVPPAPVITRTRVTIPNLPMPSAVQPPVSPPQSIARAGQLNMGNAAVVPPAPQLPVVPQRATGSFAESGSQVERIAKAVSAMGAAVVPPPPSVGDGYGHGTQLIALSISASAVASPIGIPPGNRSGAFATGPQGKQGASGAPEIKGGGAANGPGGSGETNSNGAIHGPAGIFVERGPTPVSSAVSVQQTPPSPAMLATLSRPTLADLARSTRTPTQTPSGPISEVEREVFGVKKYYSMILNMPNLTSKGGSWIIRFAELTETGQSGEVSAPVAVRKVDPAYPVDLMREHVEGTVILYAIIRANGTVEAIRVLHGIDGRLDNNATRALARWQFRPGMKNGAAVDVEAVVQIPFLAGRAF